MAKQDCCDRSFVSSAIRTNAWSIFSGLSLADISIISVVALPLYADDITNQEHYSFSNSDPLASESGALWTSRQTVIDIEIPSNRIDRHSISMPVALVSTTNRLSYNAPDIATLRDPSKPSTHRSNGLGPQTIPNERSTEPLSRISFSNSIDRSPLSHIETQSIPLGIDTSCEYDDSVARMDDTFVGYHLPTECPLPHLSEFEDSVSSAQQDADGQVIAISTTGGATMSDNGHSPGSVSRFPDSPLDPDDVVDPCKGCREILEKGIAFEFG